jgi:hypothetical protein
MPSDDLIADLAVPTHHRAQVLGVEPLGERGGRHEIAHQHSEQPTLDLFTWRRSAAVNEHPADILGGSEHVDQLVSQDLERFLVQAELQPQCALRHAAAVLEQCDRSLDGTPEVGQKRGA